MLNLADAVREMIIHKYPCIAVSNGKNINSVCLNGPHHDELREAIGLVHELVDGDIYTEERLGAHHNLFVWIEFMEEAE